MPPTRDPMTGVPQAIASIGVMPNGSYQGTARTTSAERIQPGTSSRATAPVSTSRSATPAAAATARSRRTSGSASSSSAGGPPTTTSSASGTAASARTASSCPLRSTSRPRTSSRGRSVRAATGPRGVKTEVSTPHGTIETRSEDSPRRRSSNTSSLHVATTWSTSRHRSRSRPTRPSGEVSAAPWCRCLTEPRAWKVCTTGTGAVRASAAATEASPLIQKCACTRSGGDAAQRRRSTRAKVRMCGSRPSLGTGRAGPAVTCATV